MFFIHIMRKCCYFCIWQVTNTLVLNASVKCSQKMYLFSVQTSHLAVQYSIVVTSALLNFFLVLFRLSKHLVQVNVRSWSGRHQRWHLWCDRRALYTQPQTTQPSPCHSTAVDKYSASFLVAVLLYMNIVFSRQGWWPIDWHKYQVYKTRSSSI